MNKSVMNRLFQRRRPTHKYIYLVSALFVVFWGVKWSYMGAYVIFFPVAILCVSMVYYPTLFTWIIISILFMLSAIYYTILLVNQFIVMQSQNKVAYILEDHPISFPLVVLFMIVLSIAIIIAKPKKIEG